MSLRHVARTVAVSAASIAFGGALMAGFLTSPAGAATLTSPDGNTALNTVAADAGNLTPGTPYDSGQTVNVVVQANSVISAAALQSAGVGTTGLYYVEECIDPNGVAPATVVTGSSDCEAATLNATATRNQNSTGAVNLNGAHAFKIFDLPDPNLPAGTLTAGTCDVSPNSCVLGIFVANPNSGTAAFTEPHLFSAAFQVTAGDGTDTNATPGDGTPEVPLAIGLPLAAGAIVGGYALYGRRRRQRVA